MRFSGRCVSAVLAVLFAIPSVAFAADSAPDTASVRGSDSRPAGPAAIVAPSGGSFAERLAAREIRRYVYVTTGRLLPIVEGDRLPQQPAIIVAARQRELWKSAVDDPAVNASIASLGEEQYLLKTIRRDGGPLVIVAGGDPTGTLYGAYRLAEHLGVRFYMHGDVIPDRRPQSAAWPIAELDEAGSPLFATRGIQPFHDFPEGPDWWSRDEYKAILGQLPKMRMNFFGLHTYPEGGVGPEPTV